jgi:Rieske Fe-S protein
MLGVEVAGFVTMFVLVIVSNMGGVGGGAMVIPFVILFNGFDA